MTPQTAIRILEIATIIESWFAALWLFQHITPKRTSSISFHGGSSNRAYLIFGLTLNLHAVVFVLFCLIWLIPTLKPPQAFIWVMLLGALCQALTAWIRDGRSRTLHQWHRLVAWGMAFTMPALTALILASANLSLAALTVNALALLSMLALLGLIAFNRSTRAHFLWYQSAYILSFDLAVIAIAIAG